MTMAMHVHVHCWCRYLCHQAHQADNVAFFEENGITVFQCPIDGNKVRLRHSDVTTF